MKRVLAVVLIAALATVALGSDHTVSASQSGDQNRAERQRADVVKALAGMQRGTTATLERKDGKKLFLLEYRPPAEDGMGAKFVFKRVVDGQPFLSQNDNVRFFAQFNEKMKLNTRYKLSDMLYDGKLEY